MKLEKLKEGMTVYDVGRHKMGNTNISTVSVWAVKILSIDTEKMEVTASWNGNVAQSYQERTWSKWRMKEPKLVRGLLGNNRLARRGEVYEA